MLEKFLERTEFADYNDFFENFKINVPENFNFGYDVVDYLAEKTPDAKAIVWCNDNGEELTLTFKDVKERTDRAAAFFMKKGITCYWIPVSEHGNDKGKKEARE